MSLLGRIAPFLTGGAAPVAAVTWDVAHSTPGLTLSIGNLKMSVLSWANYFSVRSTTSWSSGKVYWEGQIFDANGDNVASVNFGLVPTAFNFDGSVSCTPPYGIGAANSTPTDAFDLDLVNSSYFGIAVDFDAGKMWMRNAAGWAVSGDPAAGTNPAQTFAANTQLWAAATVIGNNVDMESWVLANFGGSVFQFTVPTGFSAWNA